MTDAPHGGVRRRHGVRHTPFARRVLEYYTHIRHGSPPRPNCSPNWPAATTPSAASRRWPSAPRRNGRPSPRSTTGTEPVHGGTRPTPGALPFIEDGIGELAGARRRPRSSGWCSRPLPRASVGQYHKRAAAAAAERDSPITRSTTGTCCRSTCKFLARPSPTRASSCRHGTRCSSARTPFPNGCWMATRTPTSYGQRYRGRAGARSRAVGGLDALLAERGRTGDAWRGPDINDVSATSRVPAAPTAYRCALKGSSPTASKCSYDIDIQADADRRGSRARLRVHPFPSTTTAVVMDASPA